MLAAIRLPAAWRFAAVILRPTITGSDIFMAILVLMAPATKKLGRRDWTRTNDPYHVKVVL